MYEHFNKLKEILDKVKVESEQDIVKDVGGSEVDAKVTGYITGEDVHDLCEAMAQLNPINSKDAFFLLLGDLEEDDLWKLFVLFSRFKESNQIPALQQAAAKLSSEILVRVISLPCTVAAKVEEVGHIEGCEEILGFYITQDELDEIHTKTHKVMKMVANTEHIGGAIHQIHKN